MREEFIKLAKEFLTAVKNDLDPFTTDKAVIQEEEYAVNLLTPSHVHFAKYGRPPGKQPPLDPIIEWLSKKGIITDPKEAKGAAFAIARSIGKNGTLNYVPGAPNALEESLDKFYKEYMSGLTEAVTVYINRQVADMEVMPKNINYKI